MTRVELQKGKCQKRWRKKTKKKTHTTQDIRSEVGMDKETTDKTSRKPKQSTD